jgi:hypothetical protein
MSHKKSRILEEIYESALDLLEADVITEDRMSEYEILCSSNTTVNSDTEIKN